MSIKKNLNWRTFFTLVAIVLMVTGSLYSDLIYKGNFVSIKAFPIIFVAIGVLMMSIIMGYSNSLIYRLKNTENNPDEEKR